MAMSLHYAKPLQIFEKNVSRVLNFKRISPTAGERDYWSEDNVLGLGIVRDAFSKNAYATLKAMIHCQDYSKAGQCKTIKYSKSGH